MEHSAGNLNNERGKKMALENGICTWYTVNKWVCGMSAEALNQFQKTHTHTEGEENGERGRKAAAFSQVSGCT